MKSLVRPTLALLAAFTLLTGVVYPLAVTGVAQLLMPRQANGSLIQRGSETVGSRLVGQSFTRPDLFWSRPSATTPFPYNASASNASNLGPSNPALAEALSTRVAQLRRDTGQGPVPVDLVTSSASGLDPHVSPASIYFQLPRVARARGMTEVTLKVLVDRFVEPRTLGVLGEPRVNVLELNLALPPP